MEVEYEFSTVEIVEADSKEDAIQKTMENAKDQISFDGVVVKDSYEFETSKVNTQKVFLVEAISM